MKYAIDIYRIHETDFDFKCFKVYCSCPEKSRHYNSGPS